MTTVLHEWRVEFNEASVESNSSILTEWIICLSVVCRLLNWTALDSEFLFFFYFFWPLETTFKFRGINELVSTAYKPKWLRKKTNKQNTTKYKLKKKQQIISMVILDVVVTVIINWHWCRSYHTHTNPHINKSQIHLATCEPLISRPRSKRRLNGKWNRNSEILDGFTFTKLLRLTRNDTKVDFNSIVLTNYTQSHTHANTFQTN